MEAVGSLSKENSKGIAYKLQINYLKQKDIRHDPHSKLLEMAKLHESALNVPNTFNMEREREREREREIIKQPYWGQKHTLESLCEVVFCNVHRVSVEQIQDICYQISV